MSKIGLKEQKNKDKIFTNILEEIGIIINNKNLLGNQSHITNHHTTFQMFTNT
jgi:hypothetical protein